VIRNLSGAGFKPSPVLFALMFLLSSAPSSLSSPRGVEFSLDPLDAKVIDHLAALGLLGDVHINTRPIDIYELALSKGVTDSELLTRFSSLNRRIGMDLILSGGDRWIRGEGGLTLREADNALILHDRLIVSRDEIYPKLGKTASSRMRRWKWDYTADFNEAYAKIYFKRLMFSVGRHGIFWSPARFGALCISDSSPPFDMFMISIYGEKISAYAFAAVLDRMWNDQHGRYLARRFLSGHRLDWIVRDGLEIGLTEVILYGGDLRSIDPGYLNPLIPYYATQYNSDYDDNTLLSADFSWILSPGVMAYGELLIDDLQYKGEGPNAWGGTLGMHLAGWTDLIVEYTRLSRWVYTHRITEHQYIHYGSPIGHSLGPDGDLITVEWSKFITLDLWAGIRVSHRRKGEATIEDRYKGERVKKFPSGVVERSIDAELKVIYRPLRGLWGEISVGGKSPGDFRLNLRLGYILSVGG